MLKLHFINVGHGDCTIIEFEDGRLMMVDINNSKALDSESEKELMEVYKISYSDMFLSKLMGKNLFSEKGYDIELTDPVEYFKNNWQGKSIFRFICTHPDMDHLTGLYRLFEEEKLPILNFWDSEHNFEKNDSEFENQTKFDKRDWETYQKLRKSTQSPKVLNLERHASGEFYTGDGIYLLSSTKELKKLAEEKQNPNHLSYVLKITHKDHVVILGGDATTEVWEDIVNEFESDFLKADVLKASHHGRDSGYHESAVQAINPLITIVSVGKKPDSDASDKYRKHCDNVWSTRWYGNITLTLNDDGKINYTHQYSRK
ncbi:hypothetical protein HGA88_01815 [Candidatus Roizmanbacteria bacterium]|nr:hypothetical protein [Candidatus Roizmanbacteria bacterium]